MRKTGEWYDRVEGERVLTWRNRKWVRRWPRGGRRRGRVRERLEYRARRGVWSCAEPETNVRTHSWRTYEMRWIPLWLRSLPFWGWYYWVGGGCWCRERILALISLAGVSACWRVGICAPRPSKHASSKRCAISTTSRQHPYPLHVFVSLQPFQTCLIIHQQAVFYCKSSFFLTLSYAFCSLFRTKPRFLSFDAWNGHTTTWIIIHGCSPCFPIPDVRSSKGPATPRLHPSSG